MDMTHTMSIDTETRDAILELESLIRSHYPGATFSLVRGEDPVGIYLIATVDVDDLDEVVDIFIDRLLQLQIDHGMPLYVIPVRTRERNAKLIEAQSKLRPATRGHAAISS